MLFKPKGADPAAKRRAVDQAKWLIRDHGDEAETVLARQIQRKQVTAVDAYSFRMTARALKRIRRSSRREAIRHFVLRLLGMRGTKRKQRRPR
jgi:ATP-dependent helicase YprA (DUF1998 family)